MAKYELSNQQVDQLQSILARADIKGMEAPMIISLSQVLRTPLKEKEEKDEKGKA